MGGLKQQNVGRGRADDRVAATSKSTVSDDRPQPSLLPPPSCEIGSDQYVNGSKPGHRREAEIASSMLRSRESTASLGMYLRDRLSSPSSCFAFM